MKCVYPRIAEEFVSSGSVVIVTDVDVNLQRDQREAYIEAADRDMMSAALSRRLGDADDAESEAEFGISSDQAFVGFRADGVRELP